MPFRFVHTADIHLDSPLRTLALRQPELAELIGGATRKAFSNIVDLCLAEQADALIIAGDLYDGEQTSMKTARFLADALRRLHEAKIPTFLIRGNHDAESRITRELTLPDSVKVFGGRPEAVTLTRGALDVVVQGISFAKPQAPESLLPKFRPPREGAFNVGILHTSLGGSASHDVYAPCSAADLQGAGFDYWALGHIHERSVERGRAAIVMPGNPQGRDVNEAGPKSATLVTVGDDRSVTIEARPTSLAEFARVAVDCVGVTDWRGAMRRIACALEEARTTARSEHLVARLKLLGPTPLAWALRADPDKLAEEARAAASAVGQTWIDKVELACVEPSSEAPDRNDPIAELRALMEGEVAGSRALMDQLRALAEDLRSHIPMDAREDLFGADAGGFQRILDDMIGEGVEDALARLRAGTERAS